MESPEKLSKIQYLGLSSRESNFAVQPGHWHFLKFPDDCNTQQSLSTTVLNQPLLPNTDYNLLSSIKTSDDSSLPTHI